MQPNVFSFYKDRALGQYGFVIATTLRGSQ